jgi:hypothetical protein
VFSGRRQTVSTFALDDSDKLENLKERVYMTVFCS